MKKSLAGLVKQREKTIKYTKELQEVASAINNGDLSEATIMKFQKLTQKFINATTIEEALILDAKTQMPSEAIQISQQDINKIFNQFLKQKLHFDIRFTTGKASDLNYVLPIHSIVCAQKAPGNFIAAIILDYSDSNYLLCDVAKRNIEQGYFIASSDNIAPLPDILPKNTNRYFKKNDNVLTLFKLEGVWTSVFYPGKIVSTPKPNSQKIEVYFEDEKRSFTIPIQFSVHNFWFKS